MTDPKTITVIATKLLRRVYKRWAVGLVEVIEYDPGNQRIHARMKAPNDYSYLRHKPTSITGVHYMVDISELVYVFIWLLINDQVVKFMNENEMRFWLESHRLPVKLERRLLAVGTHLERQELLFEQLMAEYQLKFRRAELDFSRVVPLGEKFELRAKFIRSTNKMMPDPHHEGDNIPVPLSFVELSGDTVSGLVINAALIYELKGCRH